VARIRLFWTFHCPYHSQ